MSRVADSSFLIALFDVDDPRNAVAREASQDPEPILIPPEILSETLGVMGNRLGYETARRIWRGLGELPQVVHLNSTQIERITEVFEGAQGALSWVDAAVVTHCELEQARPLCFDDAIEQAWQSRVEPT